MINSIDEKDIPSVVELDKLSAPMAMYVYRAYLTAKFIDRTVATDKVLKEDNEHLVNEVNLLRRNLLSNEDSFCDLSDINKLDIPTASTVPAINTTTDSDPVPESVTIDATDVAESAPATEEIVEDEPQEDIVASEEPQKETVTDEATAAPSKEVVADATVVETPPPVEMPTDPNAKLTPEQIAALFAGNS